jgi:hypothetical protein
MNQCSKFDRGGENYIGLGGLLSFLSLEHLLSDLSLLDQESTNDSGANALVATGTAISAGDSLLSLLGILELSAGHVLDTRQLNFAVTALDALAVLGQVLSSVTTTRSQDGLNSVGGSSVRVTTSQGNSVISGHFLS